LAKKVTRSHGERTEKLQNYQMAALDQSTYQRGTSGASCGASGTEFDVETAQIELKTIKKSIFCETKMADDAM
jgi:hypothetical protein